MKNTPPMVPSGSTTGSVINACLGHASDIVRYRESVELLMQIHSSSPISNGLPEHAAILFEKFFKHAKEHVRIFCKNLCSVVFNNHDLIEQARWALQKNVKISVITQDEPHPSEFLTMMKGATSNAVLLRAEGPYEALALNFAVMDQEAVRVEPDRQAVKAQAIMSAPSYAKNLVRAFDEMVILFSPKRTAVTA